MIEPTEKQALILDFVRKHTEVLGYPPTIREIADEFGLLSTKSVKTQLDALEKKGLLKRRRRGARALEVVGTRKGGITRVPLLGRVQAGVPVPAVEDVEQEFLLDTSLVPSGECFLLRVKGESMVEESILDGDYALVKPQPVARNGEVVVAMIDGEVTLKTFHKDEKRIVFMPGNREMAPIVVEKEDSSGVQILGKVVAVLRLYREHRDGIRLGIVKGGDESQKEVRFGEDQRIEAERNGSDSEGARDRGCEPGREDHGDKGPQDGQEAGNT